MPLDRGPIFVFGQAGRYWLPPPWSIVWDPLILVVGMGRGGGDTGRGYVCPSVPTKNKLLTKSKLLTICVVLTSIQPYMLALVGRASHAGRPGIGRGAGGIVFRRYGEQKKVVRTALFACTAGGVLLYLSSRANETRDTAVGSDTRRSLTTEEVV